MNLKFKKKIQFIFILFFLSIKVISQDYSIDYYGIVSTEIDANMAKMTSDLYYTQLNEINNLSITDMRNESLLNSVPDINTFSEKKLSFYTVIEKNQNDDTWTTIYHVVNKKNNEEHTKRKQYDSFYKILMESKNILKDTIRSLIENDTPSEALRAVEIEKPSNQPIVSTESLSGTWTGEENINKIVILRGGRGFIIFKNGASMNVTISISEDESEIIISQNGKSNASFYPELPRNIALQAALSAEPISWSLKLQNNNTLTGIKNTLLPDGDKYISGNMDVIWTKVN